MKTVSAKNKYIKMSSSAKLVIAAVLIAASVCAGVSAEKSGGNFTIIVDEIGPGGLIQSGGNYRIESSFSYFTSSFTTPSGSTIVLSGYLPNINCIPPGPVLYSPYDCEEFSDTTPTLSWIYNEYDDDDQEGYAVQVSTKPDFSVISSSVTDLTSAATYWTVDPALSETGIHYWRVKVKDDDWDEWGYWSSTSSFVIDTEEPAAITTIAASTYTLTGAVKLEWEAPGDDGWSGALGSEADNAQFRVQYETYTAVSWDKDSYDVSIDTFNVEPYSILSSTFSLSLETTYYFRIWTKDGQNNWSDISCGTTVWNRIRPSAVTNLTALALDDGNIKLSWTAPGDDGTTGAVTSGRYRLRWSTYSAVDWAASSDQWTDYDNRWNVEFDTATAAPLENHNYSVTGLSGGATYFFRIWTRDENTGANTPGNRSLISVGATATVTIVRSVEIDTNTLTIGQHHTGEQVVHTSSITVTNTGNVTETYWIKASSTTRWEIASSPGSDRFTLYCVFNSTRPSVNDFTADDKLSLSCQECTDTKFSFGNSGINVPKGESRNVWFRMDMPLANSTDQQQEIRFYISVNGE